MGAAMRGIIAALGVSLLIPTAPSAEDVLTPSNAELVESFAPYDGKLIAISPCEMAVMDINGQYTCRLVDTAGEDLKTAANLPVDVFITIVGLDQASRDLLAAHCDKYGLCDPGMRITGTPSVSDALQLPEFESATISLASS